MIDEKVLIDSLKKEIAQKKGDKGCMLSYLFLKLREDDMHGIQDSGSDIRDIESEIKGIEWSISIIEGMPRETITTEKILDCQNEELKSLRELRKKLSKRQRRAVDAPLRKK